MNTNTAAQTSNSANLRFARYSTYASYLSGNRAQYTTKTHIIGTFAPSVSGHRIAKTLCNRKFSDMETYDGNGKTEALADQPITCTTCARELAKLKKG